VGWPVYAKATSGPSLADKRVPDHSSYLFVARNWVLPGRAVEIQNIGGEAYGSRIVGRTFGRTFVRTWGDGSASDRRPSSIQGVELVGPESPNFEALVTQIVGTDRPVGLAVALPYAVVIRNRTSQAIAAIDTVWTTTDQILLNAADAMFNKAILYVKPGQAVVASPPGILQNQRQLQIFANGTTEGHRLENFRNPGT